MDSKLACTGLYPQKTSCLWVCKLGWPFHEVMFFSAPNNLFCQPRLQNFLLNREISRSKLKVSYQAAPCCPTTEKQTHIHGTETEREGETQTKIHTQITQTTQTTQTNTKTHRHKRRHSQTNTHTQTHTNTHTQPNKQANKRASEQAKKQRNKETPTN